CAPGDSRDSRQQHWSRCHRCGGWRGHGANVPRWQSATPGFGASRCARAAIREQRRLGFGCAWMVGTAGTGKALVGSAPVENAIRKFAESPDAAGGKTCLRNLFATRIGFESEKHD